MRVELSRFRIRPDKSARVDEWLKMLNDRMEEVVPMLDREEMKLEVIFRELIDGQEYLSWFSVQGDEGKSANADEDYEVGHLHTQFGEECMDHQYARRDGQPQVIMVPRGVAESMQWENPPASAVEFQRREIIIRRNAPSRSEKKAL
ncbi:MAG: hypothetical protein EXQ56_09930 [Acidobacteria bacterium]|nr:hypothetical protein [Acidobacteriota bacterium]